MTPPKTTVVASADRAATASLFTRTRLGSLVLPNRLVMAPMTRMRADDDGVPNDLVVEHYRQRASMGLIVTEGTWPVMEGRSWIGQPGIETQAHVDGWAKVTEAVHEGGGRIVLQIMHGGRESHPELTATGRVVAPSAIAGPDPIRVPSGKVDAPIPHVLALDEIEAVVEGFARAALNAVRAGFDGVQIHGANGYLVHQFLSTACNARTDAYGGSPERHCRFALDVTRAVVQAVGGGRTSIRLSPQHDVLQGLSAGSEVADDTYVRLARDLQPLNLAFIDVIHSDPASDLVQAIRRRSGSPLVANTGFSSMTTRTEAAALIDDDLAEAVGVGRAVLANPDLAQRWRDGGAENAPDLDSFYVGGARGYTDYPNRSSGTGWPQERRHPTTRP
ncbi:alkene reductase [Actinokineospora sp. G85]|uniref:alkene reductase n=1 Tax=Actinokineospora sp. G85 TaxID=3406626 RepID=UPI003C773371